MKAVVIELKPEAAVNGRVFDEEGDPVAGANVVLMTREKLLGKTKLPHLNESQTDRRGEFHFEGLSEGRYFVCVVPSVISLCRARKTGR